MLSIFRNHIVFYIGSFLFLLLCFYSGEAYPRVWPDEVLFFSPSFNLYKYNILRTDVLKGLIPGMSTHTLWMPPLFFYFQAFLFQIFPISLEVSRMGTAFLGLVSIYFIAEIAREFGIKKNYRLILKFLILSDFLFFKISHSARMESLCVLFAILSIYFLVYKMSEGKAISRIRIFLSGLALGLSFLSHPFALAYLPILGFLIFQRKSFSSKNLFYFSFGFVISISFWLVYVLPNWEIFQIQFGAQLGRKKELFGFFTLLKKFRIIFSEFRFPLYKVLIFVFTTSAFIYFIISEKIYLKWKEVFDKNLLLSFSFIYLFVIFVFLILSSESWYVYHLIFPLSLFVVALSYEKSNSYLKIPWISTLIYNLFVYGSFIYLNIIEIDMHKLTEVYHKQIDSVIEGSKTVYLQSIPDSYFYFKKYRPELEVYEFIPGELPIPEDYYKDKIVSFDAYVFYESSLMNPILKKFFEENRNSFHVEEIAIETPKRADLEMKAIAYVKKSIYEESRKSEIHR